MAETTKKTTSRTKRETPTSKAEPDDAPKAEKPKAPVQDDRPVWKTATHGPCPNPAMYRVV